MKDFGSQHAHFIDQSNYFIVSYGPIARSMADNMPSSSEAEMEGYRKTAKKRKQLAEQKRLQRLDQAWDVAQQAAQILHKEFGCKQVIVFGSLIHPNLFHLGSDVDLAVWDIDEHLYLQAVAAVTSLSREISVDLVAMQEAPDALYQLIERQGQSL